MPSDGTFVTAVTRNPERMEAFRVRTFTKALPIIHRRIGGECAWQDKPTAAPTLRQSTDIVVRAAGSRTYRPF